MEKFIFKCTNCLETYTPSLNILECSKCNSPLIVEYIDMKKNSILNDYIPLPLNRVSNVTLGEGNTPVIKMEKISKLIGLDNLFTKLEFLNPTGSFKDRGSQIMLSVISENKIHEIVEDSSGNAGASISAYCARVGVKANIFVPSSAPLAKVEQIKVYGGNIHKIEGPRENATIEAFNYCKENVISSDIMISVERVMENSIIFENSFVISLSYLSSNSAIFSSNLDLPISSNIDKPRTFSNSTPLLIAFSAKSL